MSILSILYRLFFLALFYFLPDLLLHSAVSTAFKNRRRKARRIYWAINVLFFLTAAASLFVNRISDPASIRLNLYFFGIYVSFLFSKLLVALLLAPEDVIRYPIMLYRWLFRKKKNKNLPGENKIWISRRTFLARSALLAGALPFGGFIYGMVKGRYAFDVKEQIIYFPDLPPAFDGFTISQISDIHIGSFDAGSRSHLREMVRMVNALQSDVLFFTGDIVNSRADEMEGWFDILKELQAPMGKISILGNHDYGDYVQWKSEAAKAENLQRVKNIHPQIGFQLLLNAHVALERNGEKMYIIGVENWGKGDFPKLADMPKATAGIPDNAFRILLSHDPSHWEAKVLEENDPPQLMLSGHTHGFQMGIETPAFRFSPAQFVYTQWAGLYAKANKYIYVNRGIGTVGYPGRLGIWPEITKITLRRQLA